MAYVKGGEDYGKHVSIVEIVDKNNVVVMGGDENGDEFPKILYPNKMLAKSNRIQMSATYEMELTMDLFNSKGK